MLKQAAACFCQKQLAACFKQAVACLEHAAACLISLIPGPEYQTNKRPPV